MRIDNLSTDVTKEELFRYQVFILFLSIYFILFILYFREFQKFGKISYVYCPKPLQVVLWNNNPNEGYSFVRFFDRKAAYDALREMNGVELHGKR